MKKYSITVSLAIFNAAILFALASQGAAAETSHPGDIGEDLGRRMADTIRKTGTDKDQWQAFMLDSESEDPDSLVLTLVKAAHFTIRLDPAAGLLYFQKNGSRQIFAIGRPARLTNAWANQEACPNYAIQIVEASSESAEIVKYCKPYGVSGGERQASEEYYLYDMKTATMRPLWFSSLGDSSTPGPFVQPKPTIKKLADGYELDWKFHDATNPSLSEIVMKNKYVYRFNKKTGKASLQCIDLTSFRNADGDMCDGPPDLDNISQVPVARSVN